MNIKNKFNRLISYILSQLLYIAFFNILCIFYNILNKLVENYHKLRNLMNRVNYNDCILSYDKNRPTRLYFIILRDFFELISCFYITKIFQSLNLN